MTKSGINIQDGFLFQHLKGKTTIRVQLTTGETVQGALRRFDRFALILGLDDEEILIYKHGIVSISVAHDAGEESVTD